MLEYDFEESVGCWVAMTAREIRRALDAELSLEGITYRQFEVLAWIALEGEPAQVELAEKMAVEAPTLAGILSRMERDGWLERHPCPRDGRRKRIRGTAQAQSIWDRCVECCRRVRARSTTGISADELAQYKRLCERIRANLTAESLVESPESDRSPPEKRQCG